jgi:hypothetical protein
MWSYGGTWSVPASVWWLAFPPAATWMLLGSGSDVTGRGRQKEWGLIIVKIILICHSLIF